MPFPEILPLATKGFFPNDSHPSQQLVESLKEMVADRDAAFIRAAAARYQDITVVAAAVVALRWKV